MRAGMAVEVVTARSAIHLDFSPTRRNSGPTGAIPLTMRRILHSITVLFAAALLAAPVYAMPRALSAQSAGQDMKSAGHDTKDAAKDAGKGVKKGTTKSWHATKKGTKTAYHKTWSTTKGAVNGAKAGAKQPQ